MDALNRWLFAPAPRARVAAFRTLVYLFVIADACYFTPWVRSRADVPTELYRPLLVGRLLPLPAPTTAVVWTVFAALLVAAAVAATGRLPRLAGWAVFALYFEWMVIAMSYGKVDHDRFAFLVALAALPTAGRAGHRDATLTERGGWVLRVTQIAVVATYFLAAWAKLRIGGLDWLTGATLAQAVGRRGTWPTDALASIPGLLVAAQFGIVAFELLSPLIFVLRGRRRYAAVASFYLFHVVTILTITISFAPHLVAMTSFLPLEKVWPRHVRDHAARAPPRGLSGPRGTALVTVAGGQRARRRTAGHPVAVTGHPPVRGPGQCPDRTPGDGPADGTPEPVAGL